MTIVYDVFASVLNCPFIAACPSLHVVPLCKHTIFQEVQADGNTLLFQLNVDGEQGDEAGCPRLVIVNPGQ